MYICSKVWMSLWKHTISHQSLHSPKPNLGTKSGRRSKSTWSSWDKFPPMKIWSWTDRKCIITSMVLSKSEQCCSCFRTNLKLVPRHCTRTPLRLESTYSQTPSHSLGTSSHNYAICDREATNGGCWARALRNSSIIVLCLFRLSCCLYPIFSYMGTSVKCNIICNYVLSEIPSANIGIWRVMM